MLQQPKKHKKIALMLPSYSDHDAMGNYVKIYSEIFQKAGYETQIFARFFNSKTNPNIASVDDYVEKNFDLLNFHHGIGDMCADIVKKSTIPVLLYYHNITPARYYMEYNREIFQLLIYGRQQLAEMVSATTQALSASTYSDQELDELGFTRRKIIPIFFESQRLEDMETDTELLNKLNSNKYTNITFVSRLSAHKDQESLIKAFYLYREHYNPNARLNLVGSVFEKEYFKKIKKLIKELNIEEYVNIPGIVSDAAWKAYYKASAVFVSMSEHEGFSVPILEANFFGVPVIAYDGGAVSQTAGDAAIIIEEKSPSFVAGVINKVIEDENLRNQLIENGKENYKKYDQKKYEVEIIKIVDKILNA